jgi:hypothetical protein
MRRSMSLAVYVQALALFGCGGDSPTSPSPGRFPLSKSGCPYYIEGLAAAVVDPNASSLEARLTVGDRATIGIAFCSSWGAPFEFTFSNAGVVAFRQHGWFGGGGGPSGELQASLPGQTNISLEFEADDGKRYRTPLGYCPGDNYCTTPRPIDVLTVVAK